MTTTFDHTHRRNLDRRRHLSLRIPPSPQFARSARDAIVAFLQLNVISQGDIDAVLCAVGEALANAIEHSGSTQDIDVILEIDEDRMVATIRDTGCGFMNLAFDSVPLPDAYDERGRGIPIMQRYADIFAVETQPGSGTTVTLGRYRRSQRPA